LNSLELISADYIEVDTFITHGQQFLSEDNSVLPLSTFKGVYSEIQACGMI